MSTAFPASLQLDDTHFAQALKQLRNQFARFRAVLDEIDRLAPPSSGESVAQKSVALGARLVEEYGHLASRILACAVVVAGNDVVVSAPGE
jgi:hypothetical protein